jgi:hypothetical protein
MNIDNRSIEVLRIVQSLYGILKKHNMVDSATEDAYNDFLADYPEEIIKEGI